MSGTDGKPTKAPACAVAIFGGNGDLTKRLLMPSLVHLCGTGLLPENFAVLAIGRAEQSSEDFRQHFAASVRELGTIDTASPEWRWLQARLHYLAGDFNDPEIFTRLGGVLDELADSHGTAGNVLFYLATPPSTFGGIVEGLGGGGLMQETDGRWRRVVVEKPFGTDFASATALNRRILEAAAEDQIFRIDHYLGKETVQNIIMLRFSNGIFEPLWNRDHIDHVEISVAETVGVEQRAGFYEKTGALRDMVPNHLFQLLSLTAMEAPTSFAAEALRTEKVKVLEAVRGYDCAGCLDNVVRSQYAAGVIGNSEVVGYRQEPGVAASSVTETYVAMKLLIDSWRWAGVPFYLRTGKRLHAKSSQIAIQFKQAPLALFRHLPGEEGLVRNYLVLRLQPDEGVALQFGAKVPGQGMKVDEVCMDFRYRDRFQMPPSTGYETLLYDCMRGDPSLFQRADFIESGWRLLQPMLDAWQDQSVAALETYRAGSRGPEAADALLARDGRRWHDML